MKHPSDINVHRPDQAYLIWKTNGNMLLLLFIVKTDSRIPGLFRFFCPSYSANEEVCVFPHMEIPEVCSNGAPPQ